MSIDRRLFLVPRLFHRQQLLLPVSHAVLPAQACARLLRHTLRDHVACRPISCSPGSLIASAQLPPSTELSPANGGCIHRSTVPQHQSPSWLLWISHNSGRNLAHHASVTVSIRGRHFSPPLQDQQGDLVSIIFTSHRIAPKLSGRRLHKAGHRPTLANLPGHGLSPVATLTQSIPAKRT